jgi:hypothetical protein
VWRGEHRKNLAVSLILTNSTWLEPNIVVRNIKLFHMLSAKIWSGKAKVPRELITSNVNFSLINTHVSDTPLFAIQKEAFRVVKVRILKKHHLTLKGGCIHFYLPSSHFTY